MDRATALALLEANHVFPSDHRFVLILRADAVAIAAVSASIAAHRGLADLEGRVEQQPSSGGRYVSLRLSLPCASAAEVLDVYAHFATLESVVRYF